MALIPLAFIQQKRTTTNTILVSSLDQYSGKTTCTLKCHSPILFLFSMFQVMQDVEWSGSNALFEFI